MKIRNDTLIEIATFLAKRWSGDLDVIIEFSDRETKTHLVDKKITMISFEKLTGDDFQKYRQFRVSLWYEAMRIRLCEKILSNDHAFGFILNAIETRRIEMLGKKTWRGMDQEIIFNYGYTWSNRPVLHSVYGKARIVEGFYQYFLFGDIKGEIQSSHLEKIKKANDFIKKELAEAIKNNHTTKWLENKVAQIIKILEIDSLLTIPIAIPWIKPQMPLTQEELSKALSKISKNRQGDFGKIDNTAIYRGDDIISEFKMISQESKKSQNKGLGAESIGVEIPTKDNVNETLIYDIDLINNLKTKFRQWKTGWQERHDNTGDEFDEEAFIEGHQPFFTDKKTAIKTKITILLDHSSSISSNQIEYKKATLALCEVLSYLKIRFSVYAFSTENKSIICWLVKSYETKWNSTCAKRLAQISANGSTPLADIYSKMQSILEIKRPNIFLTLTDGEPSDPNAVSIMIKSFKSIGIKMVAIGVGPDTIRATIIANNLKHLGYEKTLAVSRLLDIPNKVLTVLEKI